MPDFAEDQFGEIEVLLRTLALDISEVLRANEMYTREIEQTAAELEDKLRTIEQQRLAISDLSTPIIEIWDQVLTLPIVGVVDSRRSLEMTERLLDSIVAQKARCVIIDITGVEIVDTMTADHFVKMIRSCELLGVRCVVCGISPLVARTLTKIQVELDGVETVRNLKDALLACLRGMETERNPHRRRDHDL
jgi:rsbT co-antagonist protein RsbR